jgi:hypothetical protein
VRMPHECPRAPARGVFTTDSEHGRTCCGNGSTLPGMLRLRWCVERARAATSGSVPTGSAVRRFAIAIRACRARRHVHLDACPSCQGSLMGESVFARSLERPRLVGYLRQPKEPLDHARLPSALASALAPLIRSGRSRAACVGRSCSATTGLARRHCYSALPGCVRLKNRTKLR